MEYFDFEQAAREDDIASDCPELGDADSLFLNEHSKPDNVADIDTCNTVLTDDAGPNSSSQLDSADPVHRAEEACVFCRSMGLDCFVAQRGVMQNGCTCCISLYRKCSFTHAQPQGKYIDTLHVVGEDAVIPTGSLTGTKALRSYSGPSNGPLVEEPESRPKKSGARFSRDAVKVLKSWLSQHITHPYPTDEEKADLKVKTGLKKSQISNWLANARRRGKIRPATQSSASIPIPGKSLPTGVAFSELTPLERWKHSPPENEPASPRDIIQAMATTSFASDKGSRSSGQACSNSRRTGSSSQGESSLSNVRPARSSSGYSLSASKSSVSDMSFASAFSHRSSRGSYISLEKKERRRRRHKSTVGANPLQKARGARVFQCTFCTDSFSTKYDWQRHEKSLHLALDSWTCAPQGPVITNGGKNLCVFCQHPNPDEDHLEDHNYSSCQEKTIQERTFYRKDHLNQHLRLMHNAKLGPWMEPWKSTVTELKSRCGFCSATFSTWKARVDHLAAHFKGGEQMSQWKGGRGFESHVEKMIENAMPPYLIGGERNTLDPFVALTPAQRNENSAAKETPVPASNNSSHNIPVPSDAGCFRRLQIELSAYIGRMTAGGIVPTDEMIQAEARKTIYGTDDPWNQTCADNATWLALLKRDMGISNLAVGQEIQLENLGMQPPFAADGGLCRAPTHSSPPTMHSATRPSRPGTFHSEAPSMQGSLTSSLVGSFDLPLEVSGTNFVQGNTAAHHQLSSSAPLSTTAAVGPSPFSYDAEFLQQLNDEFGSLNRGLDDMQLGGMADPGIMDIDPGGFPTAPPVKNASDTDPVSCPFTSQPMGSVNGSGSFDPSSHADFYSSNVFSGHGNFATDGFQAQS